MMAVGASAQATLFHWQSDGNVIAINASVNATGGTIGAATTDTKKSFSVESASYSDGVAADMKSTGNKAIKDGASATYLVVTLTSGKFKTGDDIQVCGYNTWKISSTSDRSGDVAAALTTGNDKNTYAVGTVKIPAGISTSTLYFERASGSSTGIAAIKITRSDDPYIDFAKDEISFFTSPLKTECSETINLSGEKLTDGTYDIVIDSEVEGLSVNPISFTVSEGKVDQDVTITYSSTADVAAGSATISAKVGTVSSSIVVNYGSRASLIEQTIVNEEKTWNFENITETVELTTETTPSQNDEFVLANLDYLINFPADFDASSIVFKGKYPTRSKKAQDCTIKFTTAVDGNVTISFSDTGTSGDAKKRYLNVNGKNTEYYTMRTGSANDRQDNKTFGVKAGDVIITGVAEDGTTSMALCIYNIKFTPGTPAEPIISEVVTEIDINENEATDVIDVFKAAKVINEKVTINVGTEATIVFSKSAVKQIAEAGSSSITASVTEGSGDTAFTFEASLGETTFENGEATVSIPYTQEIPEGKELKVYYINGDEKEDMNATLENGVVTFKTTHFSAFTGVIESTGDDPTGINTVATDAAKANVVKKYVDGKQVVIEKNGKKYNVAGAQIK